MFADVFRAGINTLQARQHLETTHYALVSIRMLQEVDTRTHPATLEANPELLAELAEDEAGLADGEAADNLRP